VVVRIIRPALDEIFRAEIAACVRAVFPVERMDDAAVRSRF
jgi:hypothetical protein